MEDTPTLLIRPFDPVRDQSAWFHLNESWISQFFTMEEADYRLLREPEKHILEVGGIILIAEHEGKVVGTCALVPLQHPDYQYELTKMAVSVENRGLGIGKRLAYAALEAAREKGATGIYLESHRKLAPALALYRKLGFRDVAALDSAYARADVRMAVVL
ncbi:MAG: GNAT family N-acetyltransferase [Lewinella sp.]